MSIALLDNIIIIGTLTEPDDDDPTTTRRYVYQRVKSGFGHKRYSASRDIQRRRHVIPADPRTPYQQAIRARLADATHAYQDLTDEERNAFRKRGTQRARTRYNQFCAEWIAAHPLDPADYPNEGTLPAVAHGMSQSIHRAGALPGVSRMTSPHTLAPLATHPSAPADTIPPLHINPTLLIKRT